MNLRRVLILLCGLAPCATYGQSLQSLLNSGAYDEARAHYGRLLQEARTPEAANITGYADTFLHTAEYVTGLEQVEALLIRWPQDPYVLAARGRLLWALGRLEEAEEALTSAIRAKGDYWRTGLELAELYVARGRQGPANRIFQVLRARYKNGLFTTAEDLALAGRAAAGLGEYHDANEALSTARKVDETHVQSLYWHAELFRVTYDVAFAQELYETALEINPRRADLYVGLARASGSFARKEDLAERALEHAPESVDARTIQAGLRILDGDYAAAASILTQALAINPAHEQALAHMAATHHLRGEQEAFAAVEAQALAVNPRSAEFYVATSNLLALRFRYRASADMAEKAVRTDPVSASAHAALGIGLLRLGEAERAREHLERSYEQDAFNLFVANTLSLVEEYAAFARLESAHFRLLIHEDEQEILGPAILRVAEACYAALAERYPYRPQGKILLEAYKDADDFAVRIAGVPHLGLLGVSFGDVIAVKTPGAETGRPTNWARTLWHEIAHTMAIGVSRRRVPRWLTEGLSVYEEQRANSAWGRELELEFFLAHEKERLHSLATIGRGFTRPEFPGQILLSYYHAYRIVEYMIDRYGFPRIIALLKAFGQGLGEEEAITEVFGMSQQALSDAFFVSLQARRDALAEVLRGWPDALSGAAPAPLAAGGGTPDNVLLRRLKEGHEAVARQEMAAAERHFREAIALYPAYVGPGNAYHALAALYRQDSEKERRFAVLEAFLQITEYGASEARELAAWHLERGEASRALQYYERSRMVEPYDTETLVRMAAILEANGEYGAAVGVRRALLALDPIDRADAYYQLAHSLYHAGQVVLAKRAVLQSLELAPGFRDAQRLLLTCVEETR